MSVTENPPTAGFSCSFPKISVNQITLSPKKRQPPSPETARTAGGSDRPGAIKAPGFSPAFSFGLRKFPKRDPDRRGCMACCPLPKEGTQRLIGPNMGGFFLLSAFRSTGRPKWVRASARNCGWRIAGRDACPVRRLVVFFQEKRQPGGEVLRPAEHVAYGFFVLPLSPLGPRSGRESPRTGPGWPCRLDSASRRWCRPRCCWPRTTAWAPRRRRPRCPRPGS